MADGGFSKQQIRKDVEQAVLRSLRTQQFNVYTRQRLGDRIEIHEPLVGISVGFLTNLIKTETVRYLKLRGYWPRFALTEKSKTEVDVLFNVNSERIIVGFRLAF